ncbi:MAG: GNAT family N-acetyltransferase [Brucellaceae bacterium]|nr:GNAT family N-acetyltransferase [Brucellaceae bacterium]
MARRSSWRALSSCCARPRRSSGVTRSIRPASIDDIAFVRGCAEAAYRQYVSRIGREPAPMTADFQAQLAAGHIHILEADGDLAGYIVHYEQSPGAMHVESVAVLPRFAGRGLGSELLRFVEDEARSRGCAAVELYTNAAMTENLRYYPRLGYERTGERVEDGFNRVYFRKALG